MRSYFGVILVILGILIACTGDSNPATAGRALYALCLILMFALTVYAGVIGWRAFWTAYHQDKR